jgi:DNA invertase Pin-like site-specific DNA recombinase
MQVALYARVSSGSDEQANALEQQQARLERKAAELDPGGTPRWYVDIASGTKDERPELARLLADCSAGVVSAVVVTRVDRLSRSSSHGAQLLRYFGAETTPNLIALDDSLDLTTTGGRFMARLLINWGEAESERLAERVRHGAAHRRSKLAPLGKKAPFGYRFTKDRLSFEPDPEQWPVAEELVSHFLEHRNLTATLNFSIRQHGVTWGSNYSLRRWLSHPSLMGARVYGSGSVKTDHETGKKVRITNPPGAYKEVHPSCHRALIRPEQHALILSIFETNAKSDRRELLPGRVRLLTGLLMCLACKRNLVSRTVMTRSPYIQLRCQYPGCPDGTKNAIREDVVLEAMYKGLSTYGKHFVSYLARNSAASTSSVCPETQSLIEQIARLEQEDDPDLQDVLASKRQRLDQMLARDTASGVKNFVALSDRVTEEGFWKSLRESNPVLLRSILSDTLRGMVWKGEVQALRLNPHMCLPGDDGVLVFV